MPTKVWQAESIRNDLQAIRAGMCISLPVSLVLDGNGQLAAYREGCDAVIAYMAQKFGIDLDDTQPPKRGSTGELHLWSREDIKQDLEVAWKVIHASQLLLSEQNPKLMAYYRGIDNTLLSLAQSFGIEECEFSNGNGSS